MFFKKKEFRIRPESELVVLIAIDDMLLMNCEIKAPQNNC